MEITFLGHQGWRFTQGGRSFLLDPIREEIGNGRVGLPVWPARRLDFHALGPIDAVIVSHEHNDHFSLDTLATLPKPCPVYVSDLSSLAMTTAIAELGLPTLRFGALRPFTLCGLEVTALPGLYNTLEPDTYGLLVRAPDGASFLTGIDTVAHPDVLGWLARHCPVRTLDNLTNNFVEPRQRLVAEPLAFKRSRAAVAGTMLEFVQKFLPRRAVVSGQGWCFKGAKAKLNHSFFSVDNAWLTATARELAPQVAWFEGTPCMRFTLAGDTLAVDEAPEIELGPRLSREFDSASAQSAEPFPPWSGVHTITAERLRAVRDFVAAELGRVIGGHASNLMQRLYYLKFQDTPDLSPTLGLTLRNGDARHVFALDYGRLELIEQQPGARPAAVGLELWASDLELMVRAEEDAYMIAESAVRTWTHVQELVDAPTVLEALLWFTPRFRPHEHLRHYRARIAELRRHSEARRA
ncbi:MAG TPA: MBL fold metallo-hydrolase [Gammaproteobacteria bacterium]